MKTYFTQAQILGLIGLVLLSAFAASSLASDIASSVRNEGKGLENGGYFEIGVIGGYRHSPYPDNDALDNGFLFSFDIAGEYRYKRLFVEASQGTLDGLNLGATLWYNDLWQVDFLGASITGTISDSEDPDIHPDDDEETRNYKLNDRDTFYVGAGVRVTRYINNYVLQYRLVSDIFDDAGLTSTLRLGRGWQILNWNVHGIISAEYHSQTTNHYLFGVDKNVETTLYPHYAPEASMTYNVQVGVTKPLTENWVLRGFSRLILLPNTVLDSPLVDNHHYSSLVFTLNYVF